MCARFFLFHARKRVNFGSSVSGDAGHMKQLDTYARGYEMLSRSPMFWSPVLIVCVELYMHTFCFASWSNLQHTSGLASSFVRNFLIFFVFLFFETRVYTMRLGMVDGCLAQLKAVQCFGYLRACQIGWTRPSIVVHKTYGIWCWVYGTTHATFVGEKSEQAFNWEEELNALFIFSSELHYFIKSTALLCLNFKEQHYLLLNVGRRSRKSFRYSYTNRLMIRYGWYLSFSCSFFLPGYFFYLLGYLPGNLAKPCARSTTCPGGRRAFFSYLFYAFLKE